MSAPSPCNVTQTPQREFANAKVLHFFEICKFLSMKVRNLLILTEKRARIIGIQSRITNKHRESERELAGLAASTKPSKASGS